MPATRRRGRAQKPSASYRTRRASSHLRPVNWGIGTSGFMVPRSKWLSHGLSALEVNSTFYRLPTREVVRSLVALPSQIRLVVKAWRVITHVKLLKEIEEPWSCFIRSLSMLRKRLDAVLVQLPPRFKYTHENLQRIVRLARLADKARTRVVVEFRNSSWLVGDVYSVMQKIGVAISGTVIERDSTQSSSWLGTMPTGVYIPPLTGGFTYTRVHGSRGFRGLYNVSQLESLNERISSRGAPMNYVFFNNVFYGRGKQKCSVTNTQVAAICNAVMMSEIVTRS